MDRLLFQDESVVSLLPSVRATWAPRGQTPVLQHRFNWKRLSMSAAVCCRPDGSDTTMAFEIRSDTYNDDRLITFLQALHAHLGGDKVTLFWDGLPSHRSGRMTAWIASQRHWLVVERLPAYGHDLNAVEPLWATSSPPSWPTSVPTPSTTPLSRPRPV